jgi:hypothetical protein
LANTFVNKKVDLTTTSVTTLYTVPSATTSVIKSILVSEDSGNADTITVTITDTATAVFSLFKTKSISANGTTELLTAPLVLQESEILKVTAATANRLHVVLSALEIKPREVTT